MCPATLLGEIFFFNDTATTEIYTLSLHDALPISIPRRRSPPLCDERPAWSPARGSPGCGRRGANHRHARSEEHTSELQSLAYLVCRLLLEKKKQASRSIRPGRTPFRDVVGGT